MIKDTTDVADFESKIEVILTKYLKNCGNSFGILEKLKGEENFLKY